MKLHDLAGKALVAGINWALDRIFGAAKPPKKRAPTELDSRGVAIQNRASHPPEAHKQPATVTQLRPPPRTRYDD
jgi:hypothetical protein